MYPRNKKPSDVKSTAKIGKKVPRPKPEWDTTTLDHDQYKSTPEDMERRRIRHTSKNIEIAKAELHCKLSNPDESISYIGTLNEIPSSTLNESSPNSVTFTPRTPISSLDHTPDNSLFALRKINRVLNTFKHCTVDKKSENGGELSPCEKETNMEKEYSSPSNASSSNNSTFYGEMNSFTEKMLDTMNQLSSLLLETKAELGRERQARKSLEQHVENQKKIIEIIVKDLTQVQTHQNSMYDLLISKGYIDFEDAESNPEGDFSYDHFQQKNQLTSTPSSQRGAHPLASIDEELENPRKNCKLQQQSGNFSYVREFLNRSEEEKHRIGIASALLKCNEQ